MKKTILLVVLLAWAMTAIESCASSSSTTTPSHPSSGSSLYPYMIGRIEVIGNEPFTKLALRVDQSHLFLLKAPAAVEKELAAHQTGLVKLYYSGRKESGKDHILDVDHFELPDTNK